MLRTRASLPRRFSGLTPENPRVARTVARTNDAQAITDIVRAVRRGVTPRRGLWIHGETGVGKTTLACGLAQLWLDRAASVRFVAPHLAPLAIGEDLGGADLVVFDDLDRFPAQAWRLLTPILWERYVALSPVIVTTSAPPAVFERRAGTFAARAVNSIAAPIAVR